MTVDRVPNADRPAPHAPDRAPGGGPGGRASDAGRGARAFDRAVALETLTAEIVACRRCPRLVEWRERVAREKVARYAGDEYWGRPVPGFGDPSARVLIVGLAPAAHGGNRTGRVFTGDRSGDFLWTALERTGFSNLAVARRRDDGLRLDGAYVAAVVRCAPPLNRPSVDERDVCLPFLARELALLADVRVVVALGGFGWDGFLRAAAANGHPVRPRPRFGHGAEATVGPYVLVGSYHPSQQNTFTGRLTPAMFEGVMRRARTLAGG
jgi:uracil-DNA glycosylase family 4